MQGALRRALPGLLFFAVAACAQDERRVLSPDGQTEFRIFVTQHGPRDIPQIAYQVRYHGQAVVDTSFLGFEIHNQDPMLGENVGLLSARIAEARGRYRSLTAEYMQNGSIGRRINVEVRVWNGAVAFRYLIPRTSALEDILIDDELTEFAFTGRPRVPDSPLPVEFKAAPQLWIGITEQTVPEFGFAAIVGNAEGFPTIQLARRTSPPHLAFEGKTPLTCPWRILTFGPTRENVLTLRPPATELP